MTSHEFLQAGSFNIHLAMEAPVQTDDGCGGSFVEWVEQFEVWARLIPVDGIIISNADDARQQLTHWVYIRMNQAVMPGYRFVRGARKFAIETVRDPDETGRYLVCEVKEET